MPLLPAILFVVFTLLATVGAWLIVAHFRGRRAGVIAALVTLAFFVLLAIGMGVLVTRYGPPA